MRVARKLLWKAEHGKRTGIVEMDGCIPSEPGRSGFAAAATRPAVPAVSAAPHGPATVPR